jgi:mannosyltransferase OCH1-like enzyme
MIPKIIHYCWLSGDPVPANYQKCMASWKEKLTGYEFMFWDFARFDIDSSLWVKQAFEAKKYASAADYIRLYAVYHFGGIYLDMDVEVVKAFDGLLNAACMFARENETTNAIEAGCFGAEKGHPFIKRCLDHFNGREFHTDAIAISKYTLPTTMEVIYNNAFNTKIPLYSPDYFTAKSFDTGIIHITQNTYAIHHFEGSWVPRVDNKYHKIKWKIIKILGYNTFSKYLCDSVILKIKNIEVRTNRDGFKKMIGYFLKKYLLGKP